MLSSTLFLASFVALTLGHQPTRRAMVVHETQVLPRGFTSQGAASPETMLSLRIALAQSDPGGLTASLLDVSTPGNPRYRQHLTKEEVEAFVTPKPETVQAVQAWLGENNITTRTISPAGDWLSFSVPVSKANELLDTEFTVFTHDETNTQSVRTLAYSIPADLQNHVLLIHPTVAFSNPRNSKPLVFTPRLPAMANLFQSNSSSVQLPVTTVVSSSSISSAQLPVTSNVSPGNVSDTVPPSCVGDVTPECVLDLYGIPADRAMQPSNKLAVIAFNEQFANEADLALFLEEFRPELAGTTFTTQFIDGGSNPQNPADAGIEADLNVEYTVGVASGVPVTFIQVGPDNQDGILSGFLDVIEFLLAQDAPPQVLTLSFGQDESAIPSSALGALCNAYQQLGARGTSILFASGDGGVAGSEPSNDCIAFVPTFPSGCPFMTSVGATSSVPETAASFSSGGFSNVFAMPAYQQPAVEAYLERLGNTNSGRFNPAGRAYPDVSAIGSPLEFVFQGQFSRVEGTSASSPIFASVIALINARLISLGKPVLGFLNPFLYLTAAPQGAFTDIVTGSNPGCGTNGFPALPGWDPVTGLGTPKFAYLLNAAVLAV